MAVTYICTNSADIGSTMLLLLKGLVIVIIIITNIIILLLLLLIIIIIIIFFFFFFLLLLPVLAAGAGDREVGACIKRLTSLPSPGLCSPALCLSSPFVPFRLLLLFPPLPPSPLPPLFLATKRPRAKKERS